MTTTALHATNFDMLLRLSYFVNLFLFVQAIAWYTTTSHVTTETGQSEGIVGLLHNTGSLHNSRAKNKICLYCFVILLIWIEHFYGLKQSVDHWDFPHDMFV